MKPQSLSFAAFLVMMFLVFGCVPSPESSRGLPGVKAGRSSTRTSHSNTTTPVEGDDNSSRRSQHNQPATGPVAEARKQLLDTARKMDGDFVVVVANIVDTVESGQHPWSVADGRMHEFRPGQHQFARETIAAYERWRAARIAHDQ